MSKFIVLINIAGQTINTEEHAALQALIPQFDVIAVVMSTENLEVLSENYAGAILGKQLIVTLNATEHIASLTRLTDSNVFDEAQEILTKIEVGTVAIAGVYNPVVTPVNKDAVLVEHQQTPAPLEVKDQHLSILHQVQQNPQFEKILKSVLTVLTEKDKRYGNVAHKSLGIFEGKLAVGKRIDDKIARIKNNPGELRKNDVFDIIGYLVLGCVEKDWTDFSDQLD